MYKQLHINYSGVICLYLTKGVSMISTAWKYKMTIIHLQECWHGCWLPPMTRWLLCQVSWFLAVRPHLLACSSVLEQILPGHWFLEKQPDFCSHILNCSTIKNNATTGVVWHVVLKSKSQRLGSIVRTFFGWIRVLINLRPGINVVCGRCTEIDRGSLEIFVFVIHRGAVLDYLKL